MAFLCYPFTLHHTVNVEQTSVCLLLINSFRLMYISTFDLYFHHKLGLTFYLDVVLKSLTFILFIPVDTLDVTMLFVLLMCILQMCLIQVNQLAEKTPQHHKQKHTIVSALLFIYIYIVH